MSRVAFNILPTSLFQQAVFLAGWKQAPVIPLFKNCGEAKEPTNYCPVSLLPALGTTLDTRFRQPARLLQHLIMGEEARVAPSVWFHA